MDQCPSSYIHPTSSNRRKKFAGDQASKYSQNFGVPEYLEGCHCCPGRGRCSSHIYPS